MTNKKKIGVIVCAVLAMPAIVLGQHGTAATSDSIAGDWIIEFAVQGHVVLGKMNFSVAGNTLTGTIETEHTGPGRVQDGKWADRKLTATFVFAKHDVIAFEGESKSDGKLAGKFRTEGRVGTWEAERPGAGTISAASTQYDPYAFLIGTWDISAQAGGAPVGVQRFTWGPNHSYIWHAGSLIIDGKEVPHFEGMAMWNGVHKNLDMLAALDLKSGRAQEQGTFSITADGTVVREVTGFFSEGVKPIGEPRVGAAGATGHFRQTYRADGANTVITSVTRQTKQGWVAIFPGSEHMVMTRRSTPQG